MLQHPIRLEPRYKKYAWGDPSFIPELLGFEVSGEPYAEAWFGAHPSSPARVRVGQRELGLEQLVAEHGAALLGPDVLQRFGGLPHLVKLLAARRPLSIQVHPSRAQAHAGFAREQARGIPLDAPTRNYRDRNHKPELIVALTPFFALSGFRELSEIARLLDQTPELGRLLPPLSTEPESLRALLSSYFALDADVQSRALGAWLKRVRLEDPEPGEQGWSYWLQRAHAMSERDGAPDRGLFFFLLLELFRLMPGQGLFLDSGVPHAYLQGAGVEVMANSDNVLRCGLTEKHMDVAELMAILRFDTIPGQLLEPAPDPAGNLRFAGLAAEFQVEALELAAGLAAGEHQATGPEILLVTSPGARLSVDSPGQQQPLVLKAGGACLVPHASRYTLRPTARTELVRITVPHG